MKRLITLTGFVLLLCLSLHAQTFNSGSTGADGPFNPPGQIPAGTLVMGDCTTAPGCTVTVPLREPPNHIFNFTTVTISSFVTVTFSRNAANTPVFFLAQGDVAINGLIDVRGKTPGTGIIAALGGPGGFSGGLASVPGSPSPNAGAGSGPGGGLGGDATINGTGKGGGFGSNGGSCCGIDGGAVYGIPELLPLIGGSGGGGGVTDGSRPGGNGGGGGGALLIASSGAIDLGGGGSGRISIFARGGDRSSLASDGSGGSGGAIRLVATTIRGNSYLLADAGGGGFGGGQGRIRLESFNFTFTGPSGPQYTFGQPGPVVPPITPTIRIVSIGGAAIPAAPTSDILTPDATLPASFTNPVSIVLEATHVPSGTQARVITAPQVGAGPRTIATATLTGSAGAPKGSTVTVNLPTHGAGIISAVIDSVVPEP